MENDRERLADPDVQEPLIEASREHTQDEDVDEEPSGNVRSDTDGLIVYRTPLVVERLKAPPLLLAGSLGMSMACIAVYSLAWAMFFTETNERYQFKYASGQGYMASTFADLTWRQSTVTGRVFVTCGLISAFTIQSSWYVSALRNVFTGVERLRFGEKYFFRWSSIRQMIPTVGLMLKVGVSSPPKAVWGESPGHSLLAGVLVHSIGGWAIFFGYTLAELQCLGYLECLSGISPTEHRSNGHGTNGANHSRLKTLHKLERRQRFWCIVLSNLSAVIFIICQFVLSGLKHGCPDVSQSNMPNENVGGHCDAWVFEGDCILIDTVTKIGSAYNGDCNKDIDMADGRVVEIDTTAEVINTASGWICWVKCISLLFEFLGCLGFCVSHLLIWYYCEERHFHRYWLHDCESVRPHTDKLRAIDTALRAIVEHAPSDDHDPISSRFKWKAFKDVSVEDVDVRKVLAKYDIKFGDISDAPVPMTTATIKWSELEAELEEMRSKYAHTHSNEVPASSNGAPSEDPPLATPRE